MKKLLSCLTVLLLCSFSLAALADKVIITVPSQATAIQLQDQNYVLVDPNSAVAVAPSGAYYFTAGGNPMICFTEKRADILGIQVLTFGFDIGGQRQLYCTTSLDQFDIQNP